MIKNGVARIIISVGDLNESMEFYRDIFQMSVVAEYDLDSNTIEQLWNLPPQTTAQAVCLKNDEQTTLLELIEFKPHSDQCLRTGGNTTDYGLFTIAFRTKNVDAAYENLKQQGYQFICPPITYTPSWVPVTVKEAILVAPDDTAIALIERVSEPIPEIKGDFGIMLDTSQIVSDIEEITEFYVNILGLNKLFDQVLPTGMIDNILNLPKGTESRMAFINQPGSNNAALEFIQCSVEGQSLANLDKAMSLGLQAIAFAVDDLTALIKKLQAYDIKMLCEPVAITNYDHKEIRAIMVQAPNGVNIQFFEN
ncbi:MAG: VOC family protein [Cyanobacteria bacterium P01_G01_bin.39]